MAGPLLTMQAPSSSFSWTSPTTGTTYTPNASGQVTNVDQRDYIALLGVGCSFIAFNGRPDVVSMPD